MGLMHLIAHLQSTIVYKITPNLESKLFFFPRENILLMPLHERFFTPRHPRHLFANKQSIVLEHKSFNANL